MLCKVPQHFFKRICNKILLEVFWCCIPLPGLVISVEVELLPKYIERRSLEEYSEL
jgi:hypothetical protein